MAAHNFQDLRTHVGHKIVCVSYGADPDQEPFNVAIECETCGTVLQDFDNPDYDEEPEG